MVERVRVKRLVLRLLPVRKVHRECREIDRAYVNDDAERQGCHDGKCILQAQNNRAEQDCRKGTDDYRTGEHADQWGQADVLGIVAGLAAHEATQLWKRRKEAKAALKRMHSVVTALTKAGRPLCNKKLAKALGCSESHASKLRKQAGWQITTFRRGRRVYAALPSWRVQ